MSWEPSECLERLLVILIAPSSTWVLFRCFAYLLVVLSDSSGPECFIMIMNPPDPPYRPLIFLRVCWCSVHFGFLDEALAKFWMSPGFSEHCTQVLIVPEWKTMTLLFLHACCCPSMHNACHGHRVLFTDCWFLERIPPVYILSPCIVQSFSWCSQLGTVGFQHSLFTWIPKAMLIVPVIFHYCPMVLGHTFWFQLPMVEERSKGFLQMFRTIYKFCLFHCHLIVLITV